MKIYEKLGINPITAEEIIKIIRVPCEDFPDEFARELCKTLTKSCAVCKIERAFADVPTKKIKRYETIKDWGDIAELAGEFNEECGDSNCSECRFDHCGDRILCFVAWLKEETEEAI